MIRFIYIKGKKWSYLYLHIINDLYDYRSAFLILASSSQFLHLLSRNQSFTIYYNIELLIKSIDGVILLSVVSIPAVSSWLSHRVCLTVLLSVYLSSPDHLTGSAWLSLCSSIFRFAYLTGSAWLSHCPSICLRLTISQGLLDCLTLRLSVFAWLSHRVYLTVSLSVYLYVYLTLLLLHYLSLSVGSNEFIFFYSIPDTLSIVGGWNQTIQLEGER